MKVFQLKIIITFILLLLELPLYSDPEYIPPDPFLITGEAIDVTKAEEILNKINQLQEKNKEMRAKVISLQEMLISKFKDRIELKIDIIAEQQKDLPQFGIIEMSAIMNNISIVNYSKPVLFEKNMILPLFYGPLPIGKYEIKIHAIVGQQNNNWPYVIPQGKWSLDKELVINGTLAHPIQNIKVLLKADAESGIPKFEIINNLTEEKKE